MIKVEKKNSEAADGIKIEITGIKDDVVEECLALLEAVGKIDVLREALREELEKIPEEKHQEFS